MGGSFIVPAASAGPGNDTGPTARAAAIKAADAALETFAANVLEAPLGLALHIGALVVPGTICPEGKGMLGTNASMTALLPKDFARAKLNE